MKLQSCILILSALAILLACCNTNGCLENRNSVPLAGFYSSQTGKAITLDSLQITGEGMPESDPLWAAGKGLSTIYLPMRSTQSATAWVFAYKWKALDYPQLCDTIAFDYDSSPFFASDECGVIFKYNITKMRYTTHLIDSVVIADSLITNVDTERIRVYFRTGEEN